MSRVVFLHLYNSNSHTLILTEIGQIYLQTALHAIKTKFDVFPGDGQAKYEIQLYLPTTNPTIVAHDMAFPGNDAILTSVISTGSNCC